MPISPEEKKAKAGEDKRLKAEKKAADDAAKAEKKATADAAKAEKKAADGAAKAEKKAADDAAKAEKKAAADAVKLAKAEEKQALKDAKQAGSSKEDKAAAKALQKAAKDAKKVVDTALKAEAKARAKVTGDEQKERKGLAKHAPVGTKCPECPMLFASDLSARTHARAAHGPFVPFTVHDKINVTDKDVLAVEQPKDDGALPAPPVVVLKTMAVNLDTVAARHNAVAAPQQCGAFLRGFMQEHGVDAAVFTGAGVSPAADAATNVAAAQAISAAVSADGGVGVAGAFVGTVDCYVAVLSPKAAAAGWRMASLAQAPWFGSVLTTLQDTFAGAPADSPDPRAQRRVPAANVSGNDLVIDLGHRFAAVAVERPEDPALLPHIEAARSDPNAPRPVSQARRAVLLAARVPPKEERWPDLDVGASSGIFGRVRIFKETEAAYFAVRGALQQLVAAGHREGRDKNPGKLSEAVASAVVMHAELNVTARQAAKRGCVLPSSDIVYSYALCPEAEDVALQVATTADVASAQVFTSSLTRPAVVQALVFEPDAELPPGLDDDHPLALLQAEEDAARAAVIDAEAALSQRFKAAKPSTVVCGDCGFTAMGDDELAVHRRAEHTELTAAQRFGPGAVAFEMPFASAHMRYLGLPQYAALDQAGQQAELRRDQDREATRLREQQQREVRIAGQAAERDRARLLKGHQSDQQGLQKRQQQDQAKGLKADQQKAEQLTKRFDREQQQLEKQRKGAPAPKLQQLQKKLDALQKERQQASARGQQEATKRVQKAQAQQGKDLVQLQKKQQQESVRFDAKAQRSAELLRARHQRECDRVVGLHRRQTDQLLEEQAEARSGAAEARAKDQAQQAWKFRTATATLDNAVGAHRSVAAAPAMGTYLAADLLAAHDVDLAFFTDAAVPGGDLAAAIQDASSNAYGAAVGRVAGGAAFAVAWRKANGWAMVGADAKPWAATVFANVAAAAHAADTAAAGKAWMPLPPCAAAVACFEASGADPRRVVLLGVTGGHKALVDAATEGPQKASTCLATRHSATAAAYHAAAQLSEALQAKDGVPTRVVCLGNFGAATSNVPLPGGRHAAASASLETLRRCVLTPLGRRMAGAAGDALPVYRYPLSPAETACALPPGAATNDAVVALHEALVTKAAPAEVVVEALAALQRPSDCDNVLTNARVVKALSLVSAMSRPALVQDHVWDADEDDDGDDEEEPEEPEEEEPEADATASDDDFDDLLE